MAQEEIKSVSFEERLRSIEMRLASLESSLAFKNPDQLSLEAKELQFDNPSIPPSINY